MKISDIDTFRSDIGTDVEPKAEANQEPILTLELTEDERNYLKEILLEKRKVVKRALRTPDIKKVKRQRNNRLLGIITNLEYKISFEHEKI